MDDTYSIPGLPKQNQVPFLGDPEMMVFCFFFNPLPMQFQISHRVFNTNTQTFVYCGDYAHLF